MILIFLLLFSLFIHSIENNIIEGVGILGSNCCYQVKAYGYNVVWFCATVKGLNK